jgi:hypothetical protein
MATLLRVFLKAKSGDNSQITADPNSRGQRKIVRQETWCVVYDGVVDPITAQTAVGLPVAGFVYSGLYCSRLQPIRTRESPYVWDVIVDYEQQQQQANDGTVWNLNIKKSSAPREETATRDRLNLPLVNTFGELLPQLPNNVLYDEAWTITWSTRVAPNWGKIDGKTNSDPVTFTICGITRNYSKSQVKVVGSGFSCTKIITSTSGDTPQFSFIYECELNIQCRDPKWVWAAPNEGWRGFDDSDTADTFREADGTPRTAPTKLSLDGHALDDGAVVLKLPDDAIDQSTPSAGRTYAADGAFELESQVALSPLFSTLHD